MSRCRLIRQTEGDDPASAWAIIQCWPEPLLMEQLRSADAGKAASDKRRKAEVRAAANGHGDAGSVCASSPSSREGDRHGDDHNLAAPNLRLELG